MKTKDNRIRNMVLLTVLVGITLGGALALWLLLLSVVLPVESAEPDTSGVWMEVTVKRVVDGDTFVFRNGVDDRCRMLGYNAPESKEDPALYLQAKRIMEVLLALDRNKVSIFAQKRDKWNRLLCQVYFKDGRDLNAEMRAWLEDQGYKGVGKYDWMNK